MVVVRAGKTEYYSLYSEGNYDSMKQSYKNENNVILKYEDGSIIFLYYTHPGYRKSYIIQADNEKGNDSELPNIKGKIRILTTIRRSEVTKFKNFKKYLEKKGKDPFKFDELFYRKLELIFKERKYSNITIELLIRSYERRTLS